MATAAPRDGGRAGAPEPAPDWEAIERSPEFRELVAAKRRFVVPATVFFLAWYLVFVALCGYAPDFMARSVYEGLTVGYVWALSQFVMVGVLGYAYLHRARSVFDPLADRVAEHAERTLAAGGGGRPARFSKEGTPASSPEVRR
jgi:uncharacterized membrane protein (DUF485 family)